MGLSPNPYTGALPLDHTGRLLIPYALSGSESLTCSVYGCALVTTSVACRTPRDWTA